MYFKPLSICFLASFVCYTGHSQTSDSTTRSKVYATTGFGISIPNANFKTASKDGFATFTGFEWQPKKQIWYRFIYALNIYGYDYQYTDNGFKILNKGNRNLLNLAIDAGIRKRFNNKAVYGFMGAGAGHLASPNIIMDTLNKTIENSPQKKLHFIIRTGIGFEQNVSKKITVFVEANYNHLFGKTVVNKIDLSLFNAFIGLKTPIKRIKK
jgi:hypothetical protein